MKFMTKPRFVEGVRFMGIDPVDPERLPIFISDTSPTPLPDWITGAIEGGQITVDGGNLLHRGETIRPGDWIVTSDRLLKGEFAIYQTEQMNNLYDQASEPIILAMERGQQEYDLLQELVQQVHTEIEGVFGSSSPTLQRFRRIAKDSGYAIPDLGLVEKPEETEERPTFMSELASLLNRYSFENASNTPDFVLASFLSASLANLNVAINEREEYQVRQEFAEVEVIARAQDTDNDVRVTVGNGSGSGADSIAVLRDAVTRACVQFSEYARHHRDAADQTGGAARKERLRKAEVNREFVRLMNDALERTA